MAHDWTPTSAERTRAAVGRWTARTGPARSAPKSVSAQTRFVRDNVYGGSTRKMAEAYGVTPRTIERLIKGDRGKRSPLRGRLSGDVSEVRHRRAERRARLAARRGQGPKVRVRGYVGPVGAAPSRPGAPGRPGGTDTKRMRELDLDLTPEQAADMALAYETGDTDAMRETLAAAAGDYFGGGHNPWVVGADVGEIDHLDFLS